MQRIRIRKVIEFHGDCALIDPSRNGMEIEGVRVQGSTPQECFQAARAQAISEINAELDEWEKELFPPEPEQPEETEETEETESEQETETNNDEENDEEA